MTTPGRYQDREVSEEHGAYDGLECGAVDGHRHCRTGFGHGQRRLWGRGRPLGSLRERVAEARWYHEGERMELREIPGEGYARVLQCHDVDSGLQAMMAIHDTTSGHALGGWRRWPYATRHAALRDALRIGGRRDGLWGREGGGPRRCRMYNTTTNMWKPIPNDSACWRAESMLHS